MDATLLLEKSAVAALEGIGVGVRRSKKKTLQGIPKQDYPIYSVVPKTSFSCDNRMNGGYYGDPDAECQAFHICVNEGNFGQPTKYSFLCPNETIFNQQHFICDWWYSNYVACSKTEELYGLNKERVARSAKSTKCPDSDIFYIDIASKTLGEYIENVYSWQECGK